jgi:type I restriction enzyme M protein
MINGQVKSDIDRLWDDFWSGGIANPLSVIEQISFLMFSRLLDIRESREEKKASRTGKPFRRLVSENSSAKRGGGNSWPIW